jgi:lipopolysaccharide/colanic/teichoic acid biosynthesis glycosyltransferase
MQDIKSGSLTAYDHVLTSRIMSRHKQWSLYQVGLFALDAVCVALALILAYKVRIDGWLFGWAYDNPIDQLAYNTVVAISVPIWLAWMAMLGMYTRDNLLGGMTEYKGVVKASSAGVFTIILFSFLLRESKMDLSRWWIVLAWVMSIGCLMMARFVARRLVYHLWSKGFLVSRVLIVGANDQGVAIARQWMNSPRSGMRVIGFLDDFKAPGTPVLGDLAVVGRPTALAAVVHEHQADEVIVVSSAVAWETFGELVTTRHVEQGYTMRLSPGFYELLTSGMAVTNKTFVPLLTLHEGRIVGVDALVKTVFDYTAASIGLIASLPLALAVALRLRMKHPGAPLIERRQVRGLGGAVFGALQFNTHGAMHQHQLGSGTNTIEAWLVWTGLDKWPQLINVLRGEMSLVGPRPIPASGGNLPEQETMHNLQSVRPGIVGPWIVNDSLSSADLVHDEVSYVRNWEIWRDIPIVLHAFYQHWQRMFDFHRTRRVVRETALDVARKTEDLPV